MQKRQFSVYGKPGHGSSGAWRTLARLLPLVMSVPAFGQGLTGVEPGLEEAVRWKWSVLPSSQTSWGLELPEWLAPEPKAGDLAVPHPAQPSLGETYEVKRGDALILIAKKSGRTVAQLKAANGLTTDMIRIGQVLKIPSIQECIALGLPPAPPAPPKKKAGGASPATPEIDQQALLLQVFLDRQNFSAGPIDAKNSPAFQKLVFLYQRDRGVDVLSEAAAGVGEVTTRYTLKREAFRFIDPPKAEVPAKPEPKGKTPAKLPKPVAPVYAEMTSAKMLAYRSPWEFVAERYHCSESLLKALNPGITTLPAPGTEFIVPNVQPFEIDRLPPSALQPPTDPSAVITAAVVDLSRMEIYSNDRLAAIFPVASARPGLRGRGSWKILDAISRPQLATLREPRNPPKPTSTFFTGEVEEPVDQTLKSEEILPPGPNNPVGIVWINLSKSDNPEILPYGLHGTAIPGKMSTKAGLGGFRMTNWDIARAARLLPFGTPIFWKQGAPPGVAPAAAAPAAPAL